MKSGLTITTDKFKDFMASVEALTRMDVLVGIPEANNGRKDGVFGNAAIGYMNENGSPANNIPARPHLSVGIKKVEDKITTIFARMAKGSMDGNVDDIQAGYMEAGQKAADSVRLTITAGLSPALADSTVAARANRKSGKRKGARQEMANRAAGMAPSSDLAKPLYDTGEYAKNITYVIREK